MTAETFAIMPGASMRNIIITSAGRRVTLVRIFQKELSRSFPGAKVICTDANPELSSACHAASRFFALPLMHDPNYAPALLKVARKEGVGLIIPTIDQSLPILANNREKFREEGIELLVSDMPFIKQCRDKRLTSTFFLEHGIPVPAFLDRSNLHFPLFVKPYDGSSSSGAKLIPHESSLTKEQLADERLLFVEAIDRDLYDEFTVDMYYTREGELTCAVPRKRIEVRAGEVSKGVTIKNDIVDYLKERLGRVSGARGCITLQLFRHKDKPEYYGIEINARFGGGFPLTYGSGANFPAWIIHEYFLDERPPVFDAWQENLLMLRYDEEVFVRNYSDHH
ncbi:MAG TPA: ATP-grasp domain-containing protein [Pirellulales bacterium]